MESAHAEYVLSSDLDASTVDIAKQRATKLYGNLTEKSFREYVYRDMFCEVTEDHQSYVYRKRMVANTDPSDPILRYHKAKQPYHVFPSTMQLHSVATVTKITFKLQGTVHLVFESRKYSDDQTFNKAYIANSKGMTISREIIQAVSIMFGIKPRSKGPTC